MLRNEAIKERQTSWSTDERWQGIQRPYTAADVARLSGSIHVEHTLARLGAERLWQLLYTEEYVPALGAITANQAVQQVKAGLKAIYMSGWQVAADNNWPARCTPTRAFILPTACPTWCVPSTMP